MKPSVDSLLDKLPPYVDEWITLVDEQTVSDIIEEVLEAHREFAPYYDKIVLDFTGGSMQDISERLYNFCKENISYKEETKDDQTSALPTGILTRGHGDCKHYALFIGGILDAMNRRGKDIDWKYRFASYKLFDSEPHHVFIVVNEGINETWIDPTPMSEKRYPYWMVDETIRVNSNESKMALRRNIAGIGDADNAQANTAEVVYLPDGAGLVWIDGIWYIDRPHEWASQVGQLDLVSTGLNVIKDITSIFGGSNNGIGAAQKVFTMFPLPANPTATTIQNVINAIVAHENNDAGLSAAWVAAYADIRRQYTNALNAVKAGYPMPPIIPPPPGAPSYTTLPPQVLSQTPQVSNEFPQTGYPISTGSNFLTQSSVAGIPNWIWIAAGGYFLLRKKRA